MESDEKMENEEGSETLITKDPNTENIINKDPITHNEATKNGGEPLSKSLSSSSSSPSSSDRPQPLDLDEKDGIDNPEWSMVSASPRNGTGPSVPSPRLFPPIQMMDRPDDYDPNRIPSSVFNTQGTVVEWSMASNESLFSIQMRNSSFSREQMLLTKSGELTNSGSANDFSSAPPQTLATVKEESDCETPKMGHKKKDTDSGDILKKENVVFVNETPPRTFASPPRLSDDSSKSFAFPVFANEGGSVKPLPKTSHTTAQGKAKSKPESIPSPKHEPELNHEPSHHHQTSAKTPPARRKWFPCFSCCPFCCW